MLKQATLKKQTGYISALCVFVLLASCSTKENTMSSRFYHAFTSRYNIYFNGKTSGRFEVGFRERGYDTRVLPSTSPAYTLAFEEKVARWQAAGIGPAAQALS